MTSRSGKYGVVSVLTIIYGVLLCLFWGWVLWAAGPPQPLTTAEVLVAMLFGVVPVLLIVTGIALYSLRAADSSLGARSIVALLVVTVVLLTAKTILAFHWASPTLKGPDESYLKLNAFVGWVILLFVVAPSAVWALILGTIAVSLARHRPDSPGGN
jgi:hypothetical protein